MARWCETRFWCLAARPSPRHPPPLTRPKDDGGPNWHACLVHSPRSLAEVRSTAPHRPSSPPQRPPNASPEHCHVCPPQRGTVNGAPMPSLVSTTTCSSATTDERTGDSDNLIYSNSAAHIAPARAASGNRQSRHFLCFSLVYCPYFPPTSFTVNLSRGRSDLRPRGRRFCGQVAHRMSGHARTGLDCDQWCMCCKASAGC